MTLKATTSNQKWCDSISDTSLSITGLQQEGCYFALFTKYYDFQKFSVSTPWLKLQNTLMYTF